MPTTEQLIKWMKQNGWHYWYCASQRSVKTSSDIEHIISELALMNETTIEKLTNEIKQIKA